jgi:hypothetical protein
MVTTIPDVRFRLVKSETVPLTLGIAQRMREMKPSPTEREYNAKRVEYLMDRIRNGTFICPSWAVARFEGEEVRMNGQHSSIALCEESDFAQDLSVHIDTYQVDDGSGLAQLFRQFDARHSSRSSVDVCGAYKGLYSELNSVTAAKAKKCADAISWYQRTVLGVSTPSGDNVGELLSNESHHDFILWMAPLLTSKTRELQNTYVLAAVYASFLANRHGAKEFWPHVASGDFIDPDSPASILSTTLIRAMDESDRKKKLKAGQWYGVTVKGWNAWRTGKAPKYLTHDPKKPLPPVAE